MKLNSFQYEQHLKQKKLGKLYLICGEDAFMLQETVSALRQKASEAGFNERLRLDIENDTDIAACYTHAYTPPLFKQKRLLELHWKGKLTKNGQQFLVDYANRPSPHHLLLGCIGRLDKKTEQTQWFKSLEKESLIIPLWPLSPKQLPTWIKQRAQKQGLELSTEAATLLSQAVEGNLSAAAQEIEKLALSGTTPIDRHLIEEMVIDQGCFNAFDLVEQALNGNKKKVLRVLHYLQHEGTEPVMILGAFTHELRTLAKLAKNVQQGASLPSLFTQHRIRLSRQEVIRDFLRRKTKEHCLQLMIKAAELDRLVKGARGGPVWEAMQDFCLAVAK